MREYIIEYVETEREVTKYEDTNLFEFRKDKKHQWLQKICFAILKYLGCWHVADHVAYTRHTIDTIDFMSALARQYRGILAEYNYRGGRLLLGKDKFNELVGDQDLRAILNFTGEYQNSIGMLMGMRITVIPWMSGMVILPDDLDK